MAAQADQVGVGRRVAEQSAVGQVVVEDGVGSTQAFHTTQGDQPRVSWSSANEVNKSWCYLWLQGFAPCINARTIRAAEAKRLLDSAAATRTANIRSLPSVYKCSQRSVGG